MASEAVFKRKCNPPVTYTAVFTLVYLVHCCRVCPCLRFKYTWMAVVAHQNLCMRLVRIYNIRHYRFLKEYINCYIHAKHLLIALERCFWLELAFLHGLNPVYLIPIAV